MDSGTPIKLSVILSVYKPDKSLFLQAVSSMANQTFSEFEFIIVDDGNDERDRDFIRSVAVDPRIVIISNVKNLGLTKSLNIALRYSRGEYIARQDADDISAESRFERQIEFLEANNDIGLIGTNFSVRLNKNVVKCNRHRASPIQTQMMYRNPFCHSSVMFRRALALSVGGYDENFIYSQDFALWMKMLSITKGAILPEILVTRHEYKGISLSTSKAGFYQWKTGVKIRSNFILSSKRISLIPYFIGGAIYHLYRVILNAVHNK
jgi:glycosyltransferase involved in cell wall biosynthesis